MESESFDSMGYVSCFLWMVLCDLLCDYSMTWLLWIVIFGQTDGVIDQKKAAEIVVVKGYKTEQECLEDAKGLEAAYSYMDCECYEEEVN